MTQRREPILIVKLHVMGTASFRFIVVGLVLKKHISSQGPPDVISVGVKRSNNNSINLKSEHRKKRYQLFSNDLTCFVIETGNSLV